MEVFRYRELFAGAGREFVNSQEQNGSRSHSEADVGVLGMRMGFAFGDSRNDCPVGMEVR